MNTEDEALKAELVAVAADMRNGLYKDTNSVRSMVRTLASCYGKGTGYIYSRLTTLVESDGWSH